MGREKELTTITERQQEKLNLLKELSEGGDKRAEEELDGLYRRGLRAQAAEILSMFPRQE